MKTIKPFGPSICRSKISSKFIRVINNEFDKKINSSMKDYSSKLASQIRNEVKLNNSFIEKYLSNEIIKNVKKFLKKEKIINIKQIKILNLWVVRQFEGEYNPIHYHNGHVSGVGYLKLPDNFGETVQSNKKNNLNGILVEIEGSNVNLVATDGHRLAWASETLEKDLEEKKLILPRKSALELQKLLNLYPGEVNLSFSSNQILIFSDEFRFVSKLIEGNYPDYQKVFPSGEEQTLKVEKSLIQTALNRASVLSNEKYRGVKFILSKDNLKICANNPSKESAEEEISVDYSGDDLEIGFNISYIQESLSVIHNAEVDFVFYGPENSCIIKNNKNDNLVHVIMPMRL